MAHVEYNNRSMKRSCHPILFSLEYTNAPLPLRASANGASSLLPRQSANIFYMASATSSRKPS